MNVTLTDDVRTSESLLRIRLYAVATNQSSQQLRWVLLTVGVINELSCVRYLDEE